MVTPIMPPRKLADGTDGTKALRAPRKSRAKAAVDGVAAPATAGGQDKAPVDKKPRKRKAATATRTDAPSRKHEQSLPDNQDVIHFSMLGAEQLDSDDDDGPTSMVPMEYEDPNPSSYTEVVDMCLEPNTCRDEGNYADDDDPQDKTLSQDNDLFGDDTGSDNERDNFDETPVVVPLIRLEKRAKHVTKTTKFSGVELQLEPDSE